MNQAGSSPAVPWVRLSLPPIALIKIRELLDRGYFLLLLRNVPKGTTPWSIIAPKIFWG